MKKVLVSLLLISIVGLAGANTITPLYNANVTTDASGLTSLTWGGTTYTTAQLGLGTTTRYYAVADENGGDSGARVAVPNDDGTWDKAGAYTIPGSSTLKEGDFGAKADNFFWGSPTDISSIDGMPYMEVIFAAPTTEIFYFERGTTYDTGTINGITGGSLGADIALTGAAYGDEWGGAWGKAKGYVVQFDQPVDGMRISAPGADAFTITVIPEPATMLLLGLGGLFLRRRK